MSCHLWRFRKFLDFMPSCQLFAFWTALAPSFFPTRIYSWFSSYSTSDCDIIYNKLKVSSCSQKHFCGYSDGTLSLLQNPPETSSDGVLAFRSGARNHWVNLGLLLYYFHNLLSLLIFCGMNATQLKNLYFWKADLRLAMPSCLQENPNFMDYFPSLPLKSRVFQLEAWCFSGFESDRT